MTPTTKPDLPLQSDPHVKSRLTVVEQVYFQHTVPGIDKPIAVVSRFGIDLTVPARAVSTTLVVPSEWTRLPGELPDKVSMIVLQVQPLRRQVMPTPEERNAELLATVLIGFGGKAERPKTWTQHSPPVSAFSCSPVMGIGYGQSCRFRPLSATDVWIRATLPNMTIVATVFPG